MFKSHCDFILEIWNVEILAQTKTMEPRSCSERLQKQLIWGTEEISPFIYSLGSSRPINL